MTVQVNVRLADTTVEEIDGWAVIRGISRPALIREAVIEWLRQQHAAQVAEEYRRAYAEHPETDDELVRAERNAHRLVDEEPWETA